MNSPKPVRLAVAGVGLIGRKHLEQIHALDACTLVGVCDVDPGRQSVAEEFGVPFYRDVGELLERERPEGMIVATPNADHAVIAEACAKRGVHLLIEKPIADTIENAEHILDVAGAAGIRILVGHHRRHNPLISKARSLVQGGAIGRLVAVSVLWALMKPADYYHVPWRCKRPGGGLTLINLIHEIDTLRFICGEIRQVYAQSSSAVRGLDVEDSVSVTLSFESGALGTMLASDATPSPWSYEMTTRENPYYFHADENCCYFLGTKGSLDFSRLKLWRYADVEQSGWQHPLEQSTYQVEHSDPIQLQMEHFCRVVRGEEVSIVDGRDATRSLAVALAILESAERQVPVQLF